MSARVVRLCKQDSGTVLVPVQKYKGLAVHVEARALLGEVYTLDNNRSMLTDIGGKHAFASFYQ